MSLNSAQKATYLRTLPAVRDRCSKVFDLAKQGKLDYFDYHPEKEADVADFCVEIIKRDYAGDPNNIPPHGRWRSLDAGHARIEPLLASPAFAAVPLKERARRAIDLFLVSVLLDAGAGSAWSYTEATTGLAFARTEGLGVASYWMFVDGLFSSDAGNKTQADAEGLARLTVEQTAKAMQVTDANPLVGLEGRTSLLINLSKALRASPEFFGQDGRPGNIVDYLEKHAKYAEDGKSAKVPLATLWTVLADGLNPIWPSRLSLGGISLGDVWPCTSLGRAEAEAGANAEGDDLVPFHKLTQWLTYSLVEVLEKVLHWEVDGVHELTGLPEYRNGGLLVDLDVLTLKPGRLPIDVQSGLPRVPPSHPAIVEWRAMTVVELDRIAALIRTKLGLTTAQFSLAQILESATWKGGREIAQQKRGASGGGPPIEIESDGTIF